MWKIHCLPPRFKSPVLAMVRLTQLFFTWNRRGGGAASSVVFPDLTCIWYNGTQRKNRGAFWTKKKKKINFFTENGVTRITFYWLKRTKTHFCQDGCDLAKILFPAAADYRGDNILLPLLRRQEEGLQQEPNGKTHGKVSSYKATFFKKK